MADCADDDDFVDSCKLQDRPLGDGFIEVDGTFPFNEDDDNVNYNLSTASVFEILSSTSAGTQSRKLSTLPPVQPQGGHIYLYDLGSNPSKWDLIKKQLRCDQYRWVHKGTYTLKYETQSHRIEIKKKSSVIDVENEINGDDGFRRYEFWGVGSIFMMHYVGDHTIYESFAHRNCTKQHKPFIRSAPFIKEKVITKDPLMPSQAIYRELLNESTGGPRHSITTPRNPTQVQNFRKEIVKELRLSHDAFYNTYQLVYQLFMCDRKGDNQNFIRFLTVHPTIIVHMIPQPLLDALALLLRISTDTVLIHYDTVFNMGDFYLSTLSFRHSLFNKHPIIPFGFLVHSRRLQRDHKTFLEAVRDCIPIMASKQIAVVTDQEFCFTDILPISHHIFCWNHLEQDLIHFLKSKANCSASDINYFANIFKNLMQQNTEVEFDRTWDQVKDHKKFSSNSKVIDYFEKRLFPTFKIHSSIWVLKLAKIPNPENGMTNNPSESFNAVLKSLKQWKHAPLDVICVSLFHLSSYYFREIERGIHQCGSWELKEEYAYMKRDPSLMPTMPKTIDPKEIVARSRGDMLALKHTESENTDVEVLSQHTPSLKSQLGLAQDAIQKKLVTLADTGCWMVRGVDGITPFAVTLFPKETCSCSHVSTCYHIMACKLMVGLSIADLKNPNASLLHEKNRRKNKEKPSGRKKPRKNDFCLSDKHCEPDDVERLKRKRSCSDRNDISSKKRYIALRDDDTIIDQSTEQKGKVDSSVGNNRPGHKVVQISDNCTDEDTHNDSWIGAIPDEGDIGTTERVTHQGKSTLLGTNSELVLSRRSCNVAIVRRLLVDSCGSDYNWSEFLEKISEMYPEKLECLDVCRTSVDMEIANLSNNHIIMVETSRSHQVVLLRRLTDEDCTPRVEVISTYSLPDTAEVTYHAGTAVRSPHRSVVVIHAGVQFCDAHADELMAVFLITVCQNPNVEADKLRIDVSSVKQELRQFVKGERMTFTTSLASKSFCKQKIETVPLLCYCFTPWIDGTTSAAIYGSQQKEFDVYRCIKCGNWYHKYCLKVCHINVPGRYEDFICSYCQVPSTIQWGHDEFINTCTSDNVMTILLLHCKQHHNFINVIGNSEMEKVLKAGLQLMMSEKIYEGKTVILRHVQSQLDLEMTTTGKYDCYGSEFCKFLCLLRHVWKTTIKLKCTSSHCPTLGTIRTRNPSGFNFYSGNVLFSEQLKEMFPETNMIIKDYCGEQFHTDPPPNSLHGLNNRLVVEDNGEEYRETYYECRGKSTVVSSGFFSKTPWIIPLGIANMPVQSLTSLPKEISIYGHKYKLGGYSLHSPGHFTGVVEWHSKLYYYDGLSSTKEQKMLPYSERYVKGKDGGHAYYFLIN